MDIQEYSEIIFHNIIGKVSTMFLEHSLLWTHTHTHTHTHGHTNTSYLEWPAAETQRGSWCPSWWSDLCGEHYTSSSV